MIPLIALLFIVLATPLGAAQSLGDKPDAADSSRRYQRRKIILRRSDAPPASVDAHFERIRLPDSKWDLRREFMEGEASKECLRRAGKKIACTPGRFSSSFRSADKSLQVLVSVGGFTGPQIEKRIFFVTDKGELRRELVIPGGGVPVFAFAARAGRFFALYQQSGSAVLIAFNHEGQELWKGTYPRQNISTNDEGMLRVSSDARRIIVTTNPDFQKGGKGKTLILDGEGRLRAEFPLGNALSKMAPNGSWAAVWTTASLHVIDLVDDREKSSIAFDAETGAMFSVEDISADSKRVLVAKRHRNDPGTGAKPRISKFLVVDPILETIDESEIDEEMGVFAKCRFSGPSSIDLVTNNKRVKFEIAP